MAGGAAQRGRRRARAAEGVPDSCGAAVRGADPGVLSPRTGAGSTCGGEQMVRGAKTSPAASNSARTELTCGSDTGAILRTLEPGSGKKGLAR